MFSTFFYKNATTGQGHVTGNIYHVDVTENKMDKNATTDQRQMTGNIYHVDVTKKEIDKNATTDQRQMTGNIYHVDVPEFFLQKRYNRSATRPTTFRVSFFIKTDCDSFLGVVSLGKSIILCCETK